MEPIKISGTTPTLEKLIRSAIDRYPSWYVRAARINKVIVTNNEQVRSQIAMYEHGSRNLYVWPGVGALLQKAIGHELAHGVDDNFENPHFFTSTPEWIRIHKEASYFDIPKYEQEPLEYFADMVTKIFLIGPTKLGTTNPKETMFITNWVFKVLQERFS